MNVDRELFEAYLGDRSRAGETADASFRGSAGGSLCGDLVSIGFALDRGRILGAAWDAEGCAALNALGAFAAERLEGARLLDAAGVTPAELADGVGGLGPQAAHAADLVADALHRALSAAVASSEPLAGSGEVDVLVAMSGGVDSAAAAQISLGRGEAACAITLKLWQDERNDGERSCCSPEAVLGARRLAHSMGLPHLTLDLQPRFRRGVVDPFIAGYAAGNTPNPCVLCNGEVRIDAMIGVADRLGGAPLVTGHYARITNDGEGPLLDAAADPAKDQGYMLAGLRPESLERLRFPLAELTKPEVRALAAEAGLPVATKAESQDLCFLAGEGKSGFLRRHGAIPDREGPILDRAGRTLGRHRGAHQFTVGQRRGLGVATGEPVYVTATDVQANAVILGSKEEARQATVSLRDAILHRPGERVDAVRLRYHSEAYGADVFTPEGGVPGPGTHPRLTAVLTEPAFAVAPGQTAALMSGTRIVGHATIG